MQSLLQNTSSVQNFLFHFSGALSLQGSCMTGHLPVTNQIMTVQIKRVGDSCHRTLCICHHRIIFPK